MKKRALEFLRTMINKEAVFREGQLEAIESVLNRNKTLVVQRTGWGKSMVYFIATKLLREQGSGPTILISPLLSLMRNQIESAKKIGINAATINSSNNEEWDEVEELLSTNDCDILIISPERLSNKRFINNTLPLIENCGGIGFFVVDEAHCISDWGHDFRPDYRRIVRIVKGLSPNVPILATTATANDRVVRDIKEQLGDDLKIIRGPLNRESLKLSVLHIQDYATRLAWLVENLPKMKGTGIIYCTTIGDSEIVAKWLRAKGIDALPYHSNCEDRELLEGKLLRNEIKALVATDALGMGFDKPDLAFVIHFNIPRSLVSYYQQIGRAGRALQNAEVVLLVSEEDKLTHEYFIDNSLPELSYMERILDLIEENGGLTLNELLSRVNFSHRQVTQCLKLLEIDQLIYKESTKYFRSANQVTNELLKNKNIRQTKKDELEKVLEYANSKECLMRFISRELDDNHLKVCGKCQNCVGEKFYSEEVEPRLVLEANEFLNNQPIIIEPRKQWPPNGVGGERGKIPIEERNEEGRALSLYGTGRIGRMVKVDRYENKYFSDELVEAAVEFISKKWTINPQPQWVTSVPSLRNPELVPSFAKRVAERLNLPYYEVIRKVKETKEQKFMKNSLQQASNIIDAFSVQGPCPSGPVLLIDDIMNSGWTFTICGVLLKRAGSGAVIPFALASTPNRGD